MTLVAKTVGIKTRHRIGAGPVGVPAARIELTLTGGSVQRSKGNDKDEMDNQRFAKLCKDCGLYDKQFTTTDADIFFMKVKTKGMRKITFEQFKTALSLVAEKKTGGYEAVVRAITESEGPKTNATAPSYVKHHDNQESYCGIYRRGGPGVVDYSPEMAFEKMVSKTKPHNSGLRPASSGAW